MFYPPVYIIFTQACKYLTEGEKAELFKKLNKLKSLYGKPYLKIILQHFDVELFKDKPIIPEDIYLYNYIKYEITDKAIPRNGLIAKYERLYFTK